MQPNTKKKSAPKCIGGDLRLGQHSPFSMTITSKAKDGVAVAQDKHVLQGPVKVQTVEHVLVGCYELLSVD